MLVINTMTILCLTLIPSMVLSRPGSSTYHLANMDTLCGKVIRLDGDSFPGRYFSLTSGNYRENLDCLLTIRASTTNQRIIIVMDKMDVRCGGDRILIYDGKKEQGLLLNKDSSLQCGTKQFYFQTANSNTATIEFISNNDGKVGSGFVLNVAINFPVPSCSQSDSLYRCRNRYCISNLFNCDGRNWCGDNTQNYVCH